MTPMRYPILFALLVLSFLTSDVTSVAVSAIAPLFIVRTVWPLIVRVRRA